MRKFHALLLGTTAAALVTGAAWSANLNIGVQTEPSAIDPHFHNNPWTLMVMQHFFGTITEQDEKQRIVPGLAESWELIDDNTWEFKLRGGVKFQDGTPLTVDDILFTVERSQDVPGSPTNTGRFLTLSGKKYSKIDDLTFRVATENPYPTMASDLSVTHIISEKNGKGATTADYASGKATIGTGPYKFTEWLRGDKVVMDANPNFWAGKPKWDKVTLKTLASGPTRVAGLLSGTVDVIDNVPTEDIETLKGNSKVNVFIEALEQGHLDAVGYEPRPLAGRQDHGRRRGVPEPASRLAGAQGDRQGDRPRRHGLARDVGQRHPRRPVHSAGKPRPQP